MNILDTRQCFQDVDQHLQFLYSVVLFRKDGKNFSARSSQRNPINFDALYNVKELLPEEYCPPIPPGATVCRLLSNDVFIKKPNLLSSDNLGDISSCTLQEIEACEVVGRNPHENIGVYHGCSVADERVIGLCFKRYRNTLMEKMNPRHLNKSMFMEEVQRDGAERYIEGIKAAIEHLHSLGFVHNDITPSNIMIDEKDNPVVVDFDSCRREGVDLQKVKRTYGWYDPQVQESSKSNDLDALEEIRVWLTETLPNKFKFTKF